MQMVLKNVVEGVLANCLWPPSHDQPLVKKTSNSTVSTVPPCLGRCSICLIILYIIYMYIYSPLHIRSNGSVALSGMQVGKYSSG